MGLLPGYEHNAPGKRGGSSGKRSGKGWLFLVGFSALASSTLMLLGSTSEPREVWEQTSYWWEYSACWGYADTRFTVGDPLPAEDSRCDAFAPNSKGDPAPTPLPSHSGRLVPRDR